MKKGCKKILGAIPNEGTNSIPETCPRCKCILPPLANFCPQCGKRLADTPPVHRRKYRRPRGSGTVCKLKDCGRSKPFIARAAGDVYIGSYATAAEAVQALDAYNAQQTPAHKLRYTFADVYTKWSEQHFKDCGSSVKDGYERSFQKAQKLHKKEMRNIKAEDYQDVIDELIASGLSRSMCEKQRGLFSQLCKYAMQQDIINKNYAEGLRMPPASPKKERTLTATEIAQIKALNTQTAKLSLVLLYTGMRISELLTMRRDNVRLSEHYMVGGEKTESGKNRIIPILEPIQPIIAEWYAASAKSEYLVPTSKGTKLDLHNVERSFRQMMNELGIEGVTLHTFRHTAASMMIEAGVAPTAVQAILGHKDFATTANIYTSHNDPNYLIKEMEKLCKV